MKEIFILDKGYQFYRKKPIKVIAKQIDEEFIVPTMEGKMRGKAGDFLIQGIKGELYPCDKGIFLKTYELVSGNDKK